MDKDVVAQLTEQITKAVAASINNVFTGLADKQSQTDKRLEAVERQIQVEITLNSREQFTIQEVKSERVASLIKEQYGRIRMTPDQVSFIKAVRSKLFARLGHSLKKRFSVGSYRDIRRHEMNEAQSFIETWRPDWKQIESELSVPAAS